MREMIDSAAVYINYKDVSTGVWRGLVASHAGFTESWSSKLGYTSIKDLIDKTNHLYSESNLYKLSWAGQEVGGFDLPSPCWAGEQELIIKGAMRGVTQVVGHTAQLVLPSALLIVVVICGFAICTVGFPRSSVETVPCSCLTPK